MPNFIQKPATLLLLMLSLLSSTNVLKAQNILNNSGFEDGLNGWSPILSNDGDAEITNNNSIFTEGSSSASITLNVPGALGGLAQSAYLLPGKSYTLRCMTKTDGLNGISLPYININSEILLLEYGIIPISGTTDWYEATARFICPADATNMIVFLFVPGDSGTAYFDNVVLIESSSDGVAEFQVDLNSSSSDIRTFMQVNAGPLYPGFAQDLTDEFQNLGVDFVRTHDYYGPCDMHILFPDFDADANDPASYDFESTDEQIAGIIASGAQVLFRLGESYTLDPLYSDPPSDNAKMALICKNIVRHYNEGWNDGFTYGIQHWEIWNEPDLSHFWSGTAAEFVAMYAAIANELKAYDPNLKIIGPAVSSMINEWFVDEFLDGVVQQELPLDGFSYHIYYMANPYGYDLMDEVVSTKLAQYGLQDVPHYITEWNNYAYSANGTTEIWRNDPFNAASTIASLIHLQDTEVEYAFRYRANEFYFGMFNDDESLTYSGMAYEQFKDFNSRPLRLEALGTDSLGMAILAGRNEIANEILISVADNSSAHQSYTIDFGTIPVNEQYAYTVSRIDSTYNNTVFTIGVVDSENPTITVLCEPPFSDIILLEKDTVVNVNEDKIDMVLDWTVFPNPANDALQIAVNSREADIYNLVILNAQGQIVSKNQIICAQNAIVNTAVDLNGMADGSYKAMLIGRNGILSKNFQVIH
jgi:xylan 1,4-beta-xylosidase